MAKVELTEREAATYKIGRYRWLESEELYQGIRPERLYWWERDEHRVEAWLHGWPRVDWDAVQMGNGTYCLGCGKLTGMVCIVPSFDDVNGAEPTDPDWPFQEDDCPLCHREYRDLEVADLERLPLGMLRMALQRKKAALVKEISDE